MSIPLISNCDSPMASNPNVRSRNLVIGPNGKLGMYAWWQRCSAIIIYIVLIISAALMLGPFLWMISTSLKTLPETFIFPPKLLPSHPQWKNYIIIFQQLPLATYFANTIFVSVVRTIVQCLLASLSGYVFAKLSFKGRDLVFLIFLATMMVPGQVIIIPTFVLMRILGWGDTYKALIIPPIFQGGLVFGIFLMRQFYLTVPQALVDAAVIDGCSPLRTWSNIMLPLSKPAFGAFGVLTFLWSWNDLLWPLIVTRSESMKVLSIGLALFQGQFVSHYHLLMAAAIIGTLPVIILYLLAQNYIVEGITLTGLGGR